MLVYNTKSDEKDELKIIPGTDKLVTIPVVRSFSSLPSFSSLLPPPSLPPPSFLPPSLPPLLSFLLPLFSRRVKVEPYETKPVASTKVNKSQHPSKGGDIMSETPKELGRFKYSNINRSQRKSTRVNKSQQKSKLVNNSQRQPKEFKSQMDSSSQQKSAKFTSLHSAALSFFLLHSPRTVPFSHIAHT